MHSLISRFLLLSMLTGCGGALISNQQERNIGQGVADQIKTEYRLVDKSDPVAKWAKQFVKPLQKASTKFRKPSEVGGYKVEVIADDKLVNAFAAPGGYTYLSTGLILQAETCSEIAGVMGHELAHVTQRHGAKSIEKAFAAEQLAGFFLGKGISADAAKTIWGFLQATKFSRADESESDEVGLQISHDAGYNPYGLSRFFGKLLAVEKKAGGGPPEFLSSHPATGKRVKSVEKQIKKRYGNKVKKKDPKRDGCQKTTLSFAEVKERVKSGKLKIRAGTGKK